MAVNNNKSTSESIEKQVPKLEFSAIGENLEYATSGGYLILRIKLNGKRRPSSTGKSDIVASTGRQVTIDGVTLSLNAFVYKSK